MGGGPGDFDTGGDSGWGGGPGGLGGGSNVQPDLLLLTLDTTPSPIVTPLDVTPTTSPIVAVPEDISSG